MDSETLNNMADAMEALNKFNKWLIKRKDKEAVKKLMPAVEKMREMMVVALKAKPSRTTQKYH